MRIAGALLTFILQIFLARMMGQFEYGVFALVWSCLIIFGELLSLGFYNLIQRLIPEYRASNQLSMLRGAIWGTAGIILAASSAFIVIICTALYLLLRAEYISGAYAYPMMIAALSLPAFALADYLSGIGRSHGWMLRAFTPTSIFRPVSIIALFAGSIAFGLSLNAQTAIIAATISIWLTLLLSVIFIGFKIPGEEVKGPKQYQLKSWFWAALPMMMVSGFELLLFNIDVLMIGAYLPADQTGVYFAATKIMALAAFINFAVGSAYMGSYAIHHTGNNKQELANSVSWSASLTFYPSLFMIVAIVLFKDHLLGLFGASFTESSYIIYPLAIGLICRALVGPGERILMMTGQQNYCAAVYLATVLIDIILNIILIPIYGIMGAALATAISFIVMAASLHIIIRKKLDVASHPKAPHLFIQKLSSSFTKRV